MKRNTPPPSWGLTLWYDYGKPKLRLDFPDGVDHMVQVVVYRFDGAIEQASRVTLDELYEVVKGLHDSPARARAPEA